MEKICIDTDVLIELARRKVIKYVTKELDLYITFITLYEFLRGLAYIGRDVRTSKDELEHRFYILWPTNEVVIKLSEIYCVLRKNGVLIPDPDLLIGSICIVNGIPLATYNTKHYQRLIEFGLRLVDPNEVFSRIEASTRLR